MSGLCAFYMPIKAVVAYVMCELNFFLFCCFQNALELSAPASPLLLQQQQQQSNGSSPGWLQLAGHPER